VEGRIGLEEQGMYIYDLNCPCPGDVNQVYTTRPSPLLPFLNRHSVVPKVRDQDAGPAATSPNRQAFDQIPGTLPRSAKLVVVFSIQLAEQLYRLKQREMEICKGAPINMVLPITSVSYMIDGALYSIDGVDMMN
jgi:hypothetical protein